MDETSFPSLFDKPLSTAWSTVTPVSAITFGLDGETSGNARDTPRQKRQTSEEDSRAKAALPGSAVDAQAQPAPTLSDDLDGDLSSLLRDLTSGDTSAAKADVSKLQANLDTQATLSDAQPGSPLDTLIGRISDSLNSETTPEATPNGAQHDLVNFLMQNGHSTGNLLNTSG
jgi:hypothetical protein